MKRSMLLVVLIACFSVFACAGPATRTGEEPIDKSTKVRCPKCGVEFKVGEGLGR